MVNGWVLVTARPLSRRNQFYAGTGARRDGPTNRARRGADDGLAALFEDADDNLVLLDAGQVGGDVLGILHAIALSTDMRPHISRGAAQFGDLRVDVTQLLTQLLRVVGH